MEVINEEEATIRAFIQKPRQERVLFLLAHPKRRSVFTSELSHFKWLDKRFASPIVPSNASVEQISALLRMKGAGNSVHVISEDYKIDGRELQLEEALEYIWSNEIGTLLSCVPGKLGYFEDEEGNYLLER